MTRGDLYLRLCRSADVGAAVAVLLGLFMVSNLHRMPQGVQEFLGLRVTVKNVFQLVLVAFLWQALFAKCGLYELPLVRRWKAEVARLAIACASASVVALVFPLTSASGAFQFETLAQFWVAVTLVEIAYRGGLRLLLGVGDRERRQIIIVGSGPRAKRLYEELQSNAGTEYDLAGFVDSHFEAAAPEVRARQLGDLDQFESLVMRRAIDEVLVALPVRSCYREIQEVIRICERVGIRMKYLADVFDHQARGAPRLDADHSSKLMSTVVAPDDLRILVKRGTDVVGATLCLVLLSPLLAVIALAIKLTSPGPVLFSQERYGLNRRRFKMYKFRTMTVGSEARQAMLEELNEADGPLFKIRADPRITRLGRVLRRTSVDELPQLLNVLRGEMSLVGPRPLATRDVHRFSEAWLMRRFSVLPGITGLWQVSARADQRFDMLITLDLKYIDEWSLALDLSILARTPWAVFQGQPGA